MLVIPQEKIGKDKTAIYACTMAIVILGGLSHIHFCRRQKAAAAAGTFKLMQNV